ncbi:hypothetical protein CON01_01035 [Bacillus thuringiensis]|uniref:Uncharacterized protein n=1 Tax=Bacillus thuringiensis TaxID=1428 RepID=A0A9X6YIY2_BACTU|nr:hypothetical protein [Bacillus thuringiensis]PED16466.1 hypothetical protein CON01_01035 [Bacillus thuringiensis]PGO85228.1 hypothetical protein CN990_21325 [Bacillus thuringiensis]
MEHVNVLGFFKESQVVNDTDNEKLLYFVAFENSHNDHLNNKKWIEGYNVIDGHFVLRDEKYLISCEKITKEEYLRATQGFHTPKEYIQ